MNASDERLRREPERGVPAEMLDSVKETWDEAFEIGGTKGDVFSEDLIRTWIDWKRENEVDPVRLRPHPMEFGLYYDC